MLPHGRMAFEHLLILQCDSGVASCFQGFWQLVDVGEGTLLAFASCSGCCCLAVGLPKFKLVFQICVLSYFDSFPGIIKITHLIIF